LKCDAGGFPVDVAFTKSILNYQQSSREQQRNYGRRAAVKNNFLPILKLIDGTGHFSSTPKTASLISTSQSSSRNRIRSPQATEVGLQTYRTHRHSSIVLSNRVGSFQAQATDQSLT